MNELHSTIRELLVAAEKEFGSSAMAALGEQGKHIAIIGTTSYSWIVSFFGIVNSGSVAVPLDALLPAEDLCELIDRADVTTLVYDESKENVAAMAAERCGQLKHIICMGGGRENGRAEVLC